MLNLYAKYGSNWAKIRESLPGRSLAAIKYRWNAALRKGVQLPDMAMPKDIDVHHSVANTNWSMAEDEVVVHLYAEFGKQWSIISRYLPGRSENAIKQRWNVHIRK